MEFRKIFSLMIVFLLFFSLLSFVFYALSKNRIKEVYWVKARETGTGTTETDPAGNITYILNNYDLANDVIKVKPGTYNSSVEQFPLRIMDSNLTITSTQNPSNTIINGSKQNMVTILRSDTTIKGFTFSQGWPAIHATESENIKIKNNNFTNNHQAIYVWRSNHTNIVHNIFSQNMRGVAISVGYYSQISNNTFTQNSLGIILSQGYNTTITDNHMNSSGIFLSGSKKTYTSQTIPPSNTLNGKPIYYYTANTLPATFPKTMGELILANVENQQLNNLVLKNGYVGIQLGYSHNLHFSNVTIKHQEYGMYYTHCHNITVQNSTFQTTQLAVHISNSYSNTITETNFLYNAEGLHLTQTNHSIIYKNNFIGNGIHAIDETGENMFNNTMVGNYWDDYQGKDPDNDGIGETPYTIPNGSLDYLPAIHPFTSLIPQ